MQNTSRCRRFGASLACLLAVVLVGAMLFAQAGSAAGAAPAGTPVKQKEVVVGAAQAATQEMNAPGRETPAEDRAKGKVYKGLAKGAAGRACAGLYVETGSREPVCTHGPDQAPAGANVQSDTPATTTGAATAGVSCYGDGVTGNRIQAVYARAADIADRYDSLVGSMLTWAAKTDAVFNDSAAQTGGIRHPRWVTDGACNLSIVRVQLSSAGDDSFTATRNEMSAMGLNRTDRKYMVWVDSNVYCGIGSLWSDDRATADNYNNRGPSYSRIDRGCWGSSTPVEAHEIMHNLGGVQPSAPHATSGYHCTDESDRMCYVDAGGVTMTYVCPSTRERLFDCNNDDYFHTSPAAGSYLAGKWNSANNSFLEKVNPGTVTPTPSPTPTPTPVTSTYTTSDKVSPGRTKTYNLSTGAGAASATLTFTSGSPLTVKIMKGTTMLSQASGPSPVTASAQVTAGATTITVGGSAIRNNAYTLRVTYPRP